MPQTKLYTLEEFVDMPEFEHHELIAGEPRLRMTRPVHSRIAVRLSSALHSHVEANRLGEVFVASTWIATRRNPDTVRIPDLMFVRAASLVGLDPDAPAIFKADLAVEILSPSNSRREMNEKMTEYFGIGVREVWIIDPKRGTVTTHRPSGEGRTYIATDVLDGGDVVPGFRYPLAQLFATPDFG